MPTLSFDGELPSYAKFFDRGNPWAVALRNRTKSTPFDNASADLCLNWETTSEVAALISTFTLSMDGVWSKVFEVDDPADFLGKASKKIGDELAQEIPSQYKMKVVHKAKKLTAEFLAHRRSAREIIPLDTLWQTMLKAREFKLSIWSSQRLSYGSLFYAFDDYVAQVSGYILNKPSEEIRNGDQFYKELKDEMGDDIYRLLFEQPDIKLARLVRHSLSHNGGRVVGKLKEFKDTMKDPFPFEVDEDNRLQIKAKDVRKLFEILKPAVDAVTDRALEVVAKRSGPQM